MAESVVFTLASKVLSKIAAPAIIAAYKEGLSIREAEDELSKLHVTIETIQAVLLDAEKKEQGSNAVRNWIKRLKGVLYDADDLFDEVATRDLLEQQNKKGHHNIISKVLASSSKLSLVISRYSIAKEVKAIRKSLVEITTDMAPFGFLICQNEVPRYGIRTGQDPGCFVDAELVVGRENDKNVVLDMLFNESDSVVPAPLIIAIVGIGGLGKTTLSQLIYNDVEVRENFDNRWFACISDISDEREVLGKVFQSIQKGDHSSLSVSQLQTNIRDSVKGKRFLLVLDDVWEDHRGRWQDRMSLFRSCAEGSKLIVTTRLRSVVDAVSASRDHNLEGLSEENAWRLFKRLAFTPEYENDPIRIRLGKKILRRCRGVPLAIQSAGSLLSERNTMSEWQAIEKEGLQKIGKKYHDETMSVIKISYDHLPSNLKHCFAYCSLFPKDYKFMKRELIHHWSAQGYVEPNNEETDFMHLLRRGFFQEAMKDFNGEVISCKMHDILHDLALYVAGEESIATSSTTLNITSSTFTRHISIEGCESEVALLKVERLRSFLMMRANSIWNHTTLDKQIRNFKMLRTLSLKLGRNQELPSSIGELKLMRYLNLSSNHFEVLPDSVSNLVNLFALNLDSCSNLKALPKTFEKLINLRYLNNTGCSRLEMPIRIGELTSLEYLSEFVVRKRSGFAALAGLHQQLRGELLIRFVRGIEVEDECNWKLPVSVQTLTIDGYRGVRILDWGIMNGSEELSNHLTYLKLEWCDKVRRLPPLQCLPNLRWLSLRGLRELEFVEWEEEDYCTSSSPFFPCLQTLKLFSLTLLKRWRKTGSTPLAFPLLSDLYIQYCPSLELASFPQCRLLREIDLRDVDSSDVMQRDLPSTLFCPSPLEGITIRDCKWLSSLQVEATVSLRRLAIQNCSGLKSLQLASPDLQRAHITNCEGLVSVEAVTPSLVYLTIRDCKEFENLVVPWRKSMNALERIDVSGCPKFNLPEPRFNWYYFLWGIFKFIFNLIFSRGRIRTR